MEKTYYTIYKILNKIDGKIYIGSHKTKNLEDGYMGSGKYLKRAIEKYGVESFEKTILFIFETSEEMYNKEAEIVNEEFLTTQNTYNLRVGGFGGFDYVNLQGLNKHNCSEEYRKKISETCKKNGIKPNPKYLTGNNFSLNSKRFSGKKHSKESIQIIRDKAKLRTGNKNSQFDTEWITNGILNKKVKKNSVYPEGFYKGRIKILPV